jgi:N-acetyl-anhydromuramyl-L-alanine amidase AmpD
MTLFTTPPLTVTTVHADAAHFGGTPQGWDFITVHATGGTNSLGWLTTDSPTTGPNRNPVSVHRLIAKDGTIYKIVEDTDEAWHAGFGVAGPVGPNSAINFNQKSLGIELENLNDGKDLYPAPQLDACAAQIVEWWGKYGWLCVVGHNMVDTRKNDPQGLDWNDLNRRIFSKFSSSLYAASLSPTAVTGIKTAIAQLQAVLGGQA